MKKFMVPSMAVLITSVFILSSCTARAQETSEMTRVFNEARLPLLRERVNPRDFSLTAIQLNQAETTLDLSSHRGKVVFLNFWATWCPPCRDEMPSMESLYNRYKDKGLEILAVNIQEGQEEVYRFMQNYNLSFPVPLDRDGRISNSYGIQAIPTSFIIDREGMIVSRLVGSIDWDTPAVHRVFELLLD